MVVSATPPKLLVGSIGYTPSLGVVVGALRVRLVLLNALPLNIFGLEEGEFIELVIERVGVDELKKVVSEVSEVACFIRHRATIEILSRLLGIELKPSAELYRYRPSDKLAVITLRKPVRGQEVEDLSVEDLEIYLVKPV